MRTIFSLCILSIVLFSCSETPKVKEEVTVNKLEPTIPEEDIYDYDTLQGMYLGGFGGSDIRIILNYISKKNAIGYNIHKGLQRNITGKVSRKGDTVQLVMTEPGDNKFDGVFTINFIGNDDSPYGSWESNSGKIPRQEFKLKKIITDTDRGDHDQLEDINVSNFANVFYYLTDSIGEYSFKEDGLVTLNYYENLESETIENEDEERALEQMIELKGSWSLKGTHVTINWEPNDIFPNNILELDMIDNEYGEYKLKGKGEHKLWMMWY
ncbi:MAG: hypothetical protein ACJA0U_002706 [Salibacteraceae bacterium]|jgi:hypothetical protein